MKISKERLIEWAKNLQADDVEVEFDGIGGGESTPGRWEVGYGLKISACEEAPDEVKSGLQFLC